jgi:hypothetical protein
MFFSSPFDTKSWGLGGDAWAMSHPSPLDPRLADAIARLARRGVGAAEIRRRVGPLAARLKVQRPSYSTVRRIVAAEKARPRPAVRISPLDSLVQGRVPTPRELETALQRHRNRS